MRAAAVLHVVTVHGEQSKAETDVPRRGGGRRTSRPRKSTSTRGRPASWFGGCVCMCMEEGRVRRVGGVVDWLSGPHEWPMDHLVGTNAYLGRGDAPWEESLFDVVQGLRRRVEPQRQHADLFGFVGVGYVCCCQWPNAHAPRARIVWGGWVGTYRRVLGEGYGGLQLLGGVEHLAEGHLHVGLWGRASVRLFGSGTVRGTNYVCDRRGFRPSLYLSGAEPHLPEPHVLQRALAPAAGHCDLRRPYQGHRLGVSISCRRQAVLSTKRDDRQPNQSATDRVWAPRLVRGQAGDPVPKRVHHGLRRGERVPLDRHLRVRG